MALWNMELGDGLSNVEISHSITHGEESVSIFCIFLGRCLPASAWYEYRHMETTAKAAKASVSY
jgi:hypothetical protein